MRIVDISIWPDYTTQVPSCLCTGRILVLGEHPHDSNLIDKGVMVTFLLLCR